METCKHCGYPIRQDENGNWLDPDAADPWDYECIQRDDDHEPGEH